MHHRCLYISHPSSEGIPSPTQEYNLTYSKPAPPQAFLLCLLVPIPLLLDIMLPDDRQEHLIQRRRADAVVLDAKLFLHLLEPHNEVPEGALRRDALLGAHSRLLAFGPKRRLRDH